MIINQFLPLPPRFLAWENRGGGKWNFNLNNTASPQQGRSACMGEGGMMRKGHANTATEDLPHIYYSPSIPPRPCTHTRIYLSISFSLSPLTKPPYQFSPSSEAISPKFPTLRAAAAAAAEARRLSRRAVFDKSPLMKLQTAAGVEGGDGRR